MLLQDENTALLKWETASETNVAGFQPQKKVEGLDSRFNLIGFVEGAGTTSEPQSYEHESEVAPGRVNAFRLSLKYLDGSERVIGDTVKVRPPVPENKVRPITPNPLSEEATLRLLLASNSLVVDAKVYTLDGSVLEALVPGRTLPSGAHDFRWEVGDTTPDGLYEVRTEIRDDDEPAVQDTSYAAVIRSPQNAFQIGTTPANGTVSTQARSRFPSLHDVPEFEVRDAQGNVLRRAEVSGKAQFVVTTSNGLQTFRRSVVDGQNSFTLTVSP